MPLHNPMSESIVSSGARTGQDPRISVQGISKQFGAMSAVNQLSFAVHAGDILGLIGQNGAGKTTTLQILAGIFRPTSGRVAIAGHDLLRSPHAAKSAVGYVPDNPRLFAGLTVWEHLSFTAAAYGVKDYQKPATELLAQFELDGKRDEVAQNLSRGMRQKVSVVCAYLHDPEVLLFDEPLTGLDPQGIRILTDSIRHRAALGTAVILSSHLLSLVQELSSDLLLMHHGNRVAFGPLPDVLNHTSNRCSDPKLEELFFSITNRRSA